MAKHTSPRPATPTRSIDVAVPGGALPVTIWGEPAPDTVAVLAVHGLTMSHRTWSAVAARLPHIALIAPDLRGRGAASSLPGPYGFTRHVRDIEAVTDHLGLQRIVAAGHAMGGYVAEQLAARNPELVAELVLVDGGLTPPAPRGVSIDEHIERILGPSLRRMDTTYASRSDYRAFWRAHPAFTGPPAEWNPAIASFVDYDLAGPDGELRSRTVKAAVRQDFAEGRFDERTRTTAFGLSHLPITLLRAQGGILGQKPGLIPDDLLAEYREYLPQINETFLPGTNHYTVTLAEPGLTAVAGAMVDAVARATARATTGARLWNMRPPGPDHVTLERRRW